MKNERTQKITSFIFAKLFYVVLGLLAASSVIAYAAWSDAQTGGSGKLSESNWNALITQLQALPQSPSTPGSWTCRAVSGTNVTTTYCNPPEKLIQGSCQYSSIAISGATAEPGFVWDYGSGHWGVTCPAGGYVGVWLYCCQ